MEFPHGPSRLLERIFAPFLGDLPDCALPGDIRARKRFTFTKSIERLATASSTGKWIQTPAARLTELTSSRPTKRTRAITFPSSRKSWKQWRSRADERSRSTNSYREKRSTSCILRIPYYLVPDGEAGAQAFAVIRDANNRAFSLVNRAFGELRWPCQLVVRDRAFPRAMSGMRLSDRFEENFSRVALLYSMSKRGHSEELEHKLSRRLCSVQPRRCSCTIM